MSTPDLIMQILDLARWAPSGDNTQPWRFELVDAQHLVVHGFDTRSYCVYDLDGHASQLSLGALIETIVLAAGAHNMRTDVRRRSDYPDTTPTFDISFAQAPALVPDHLWEHIVGRSVQRRPLQRRALRADEKTALTAVLPPGYRVLWLEQGQRWAMAKCLFGNAKLRLTMPEAYLVHRSVIEWGARTSRDRIPDQALGVDPLTARMMHTIMHSWQRVHFFNTWLAGTLVPRIQMDLIPALACAAHLVLLAPQAARTTEHYVAAGRAMQRVWLAASALGLQCQPEMTPLIFARYVREGRSFSRSPGMHEQARVLADKFARVVGDAAFEDAVFMLRIGAGAPAVARSERLALTELMVGATAPS